MSRTQVTEVRCDLCNYGGPYTRPEDFQRFGDVDLCKWCADDQPKTRLECGRHVVTFTADSWSCSCGEVYRRPLFFLSRVAAVVPNLLNATANAHVESA